MDYTAQVTLENFAQCTLENCFCTILWKCVQKGQSRSLQYLSNCRAKIYAKHTHCSFCSTCLLLKMLGESLPQKRNSGDNFSTFYRVAAPLVSQLTVSKHYLEEHSKCGFLKINDDVLKLAIVLHKKHKVTLALTSLSENETRHHFDCSLFPVQLPLFGIHYKFTIYAP